MLELRRSETVVLMTGVSQRLEKISVLKITSGINDKGRIIKEHFLFCTQKPNQAIDTITFLREEHAINRFYEKRSVAWETKILIMVPSIKRREISIKRK